MMLRLLIQPFDLSEWKAVQSWPRLRRHTVPAWQYRAHGFSSVGLWAYPEMLNSAFDSVAHFAGLNH